MELITAERAVSRTPRELLQLPPNPPPSGERVYREAKQLPHRASKEPQHRRTINPEPLEIDQLTTVKLDRRTSPFDVLRDTTEDPPIWITLSEDSVVYMTPSFVHEAVRSGAQKIILDQLSDWQIRSCGSTAVELEGCKFIAQQPDTQLEHRDQLYPGLVIEVAHSQSIKNAMRRVKNYIRGTYGQIRSAILISIKSPPEESIISHWRATFGSSAGTVSLRVEEVFHKAFRASDGSKVNEDAYLTIPLRDFGLKVTRQANNAVVRCGDIFEVLEKAEAKQTRKRSEQKALCTRLSKRIRIEESTSSSSPESLYDSHEELFERAENNDERKAEMQSDYEGRSNTHATEKHPVSSRLRARIRAVVRVVF